MSSRKKRALKALNKKWEHCTRCSLCEDRTKTVFADGNPDASVMIIGEAPGKEEDLKGRPFIGESGQLLREILADLGIRRNDVYVTNSVLCRPKDNRDPFRVELESCRPRLMEQIRIVDPDLIIASGRIASQTLTGNKKLAITRDHGQIYDAEFEGEMGPYTIPVLVTIHPAALLRNPDLHEGGQMRDTIEEFTMAFGIIKHLKTEYGRDA